MVTTTHFISLSDRINFSKPSSRKTPLFRIIPHDDKINLRVTVRVCACVGGWRRQIALKLILLPIDSSRAENEDSDNLSVSPIELVFDAVAEHWNPSLLLIDWNAECTLKSALMPRISSKSDDCAEEEGLSGLVLMRCRADNCCHRTSVETRILRREISMKMSDVALKKFADVMKKKKKNKALGGKSPTLIITLEYEWYTSAKYLEVADVFFF